MMKVNETALIAVLLMTAGILFWQGFHYLLSREEVLASHQRLAELSSEIELQTGKADDLERKIEELATELSSEESNAFTIADDLARIPDAQHADYENLWNEAIATARREFELMRAETMRTGREELQNRIANLDTEARRSALRIEAEYGPALKQLGISGERYHQIIAAATNAQVEFNNHLSSYEAGTISEQDFRALVEGKSARAVLLTQLSATEQSAVAAAMEQRHSGIGGIQMLVLNAIPDVAPQTRQLIASVYYDALTELGPGYTGRNDNPFRGRAEFERTQVIPAVRELLVEVLDVSELDDMERFFDHRDASNEGSALRAEALP